MGHLSFSLQLGERLCDWPFHFLSVIRLLTGRDRSDKVVPTADVFWVDTSAAGYQTKLRRNKRQVKTRSTGEEV